MATFGPDNSAADGVLAVAVASVTFELLDGSATAAVDGSLTTFVATAEVEGSDPVATRVGVAAHPDARTKNAATDNGDTGRE